MSKGSKPRPSDKEKFIKNYDKIFGKKRRKPKKEVNILDLKPEGMDEGEFIDKFADIAKDLKDN